MLGKILARLTPGHDDVTDPEILEHYQREADQRHEQIEEHKRFATWISGFMGAAQERNHFGPDIDAALHVHRRHHHG